MHRFLLGNVSTASLSCYMKLMKINFKSFLKIKTYKVSLLTQLSWQSTRLVIGRSSVQLRALACTTPGVAQLGSAPALGAGGHGFKSHRQDWVCSSNYYCEVIENFVHQQARFQSEEERLVRKTKRLEVRVLSHPTLCSLCCSLCDFGRTHFVGFDLYTIEYFVLVICRRGHTRSHSEHGS